MFAAAIPQCAAGDVTQAESLKTMAVWAHHGEIDDTVPLSGSREMVAALKGGRLNECEIHSVSKHKP